MRPCISHHWACDCRETGFKELETKYALAIKALKQINQESAQIWERRIAEDALVEIERIEIKEKKA